METVNGMLVPTGPYIVGDYVADTGYYLCDDVENGIRKIYPEAFDPSHVEDDEDYRSVLEYVRESCGAGIDPDATGIVVYELDEDTGETWGINTHAKLDVNDVEITDIR